MTLERAIEILERHQKWRTGQTDDYSPLFTPHELTEAIDTILKHFNLEKENGIGYWK